MGLENRRRKGSPGTAAESLEDKTMRKAKKQPRTTHWLLSLFSPPLRDRCCETCGRPHVGPVEPKPVEHFNVGNAEVQVFQAGSFGKPRHEFRVHCLNRYRDGWFPQSFFSDRDLVDLVHSLQLAFRFIRKEN